MSAISFGAQTNTRIKAIEFASRLMVSGSSQQAASERGTQIPSGTRLKDINDAFAYLLKESPFTAQIVPKGSKLFIHFVR